MDMRNLMDSVQKIMEAPDNIYYHGSEHKIVKFSDEFMGSGHDEYGPGIYFTNFPKTALGYANGTGYVYECQINPKKLLSKKTRINKAVLMNLIQKSPDEYAWTDWDENKNKAIVNATNNYIEYNSNMYDALMSVWGDFYRDYSTEFCRNLVSIGFDAYEFVFSHGEHFLIVYNVGIIKVLNVYTDEQARATFLKSEE